MGSIEDNWAVILGVSQGTGAAIARAVTRDPGLSIFGVHRGHHPAAADAVASGVIAEGRRIHMHVADAGPAESAVLGADAVLKVAGPRRVRLFVHSIANASVGPLVLDGDNRLVPKQIEKTFSSMAHSFVYWSRELFARDLLAPGACLLGLTNPIAGSLVRDLALIAATKAALEIYVRALAMELGPRGHRVNLLSFGLVDTRAGRVGFASNEWDRAAQRAAWVTPARRLCTVDEVARFVSVLCGDAAAWFNGATIDFTGGMTQGLLDSVLRPDRE